jgi:uncharacterized phage-associated protein
MVNVFTVARYLLGPMRGKTAPVRLQKLCYSAQAWYLAKRTTSIPLSLLIISPD